MDVFGRCEVYWSAVDCRVPTRPHPKAGSVLVGKGEGSLFLFFVLCVDFFLFLLARLADSITTATSHL